MTRAGSCPVAFVCALTFGTRNRQGSGLAASLRSVARGRIRASSSRAPGQREPVDIASQLPARPGGHQLPPRRAHVAVELLAVPVLAVELPALGAIHLQVDLDELAEDGARGASVIVFERESSERHDLDLPSLGERLGIPVRELARPRAVYGGLAPERREPVAACRAPDRGDGGDRP